MNRLHDLLEFLSSRGIYWVGGHDVPAHVMAAAKAEAKALAPEAICFWLGSSEDIKNLKPVPDLVRLPYVTTWWEFDSSEIIPNSVTGVLLHQQKNGSYVGQGWMRAQGIWALSWSGTVNTQSWEIFTFHDAPESVQAARWDVWHVFASVSAMNCSNVYSRKNEPSDRLQKSRAKRGKPSLFSFWTLHVKSSATGGDVSLGGTHASPRVHLRRGHARQYAPGKWTWVQPHAVGDRAAGIVHKDYDMSRLLRGQA